MPAETIVTLAAVLATFGFFAGMLVFADLTWDKPRHKDRDLNR